MPDFNVTVQVDLLDPPHEREVIEHWIREALTESDHVLRDILWKDDPYFGDTPDIDPMVRLQIRLVIHNEHKQGGYAATKGRTFVLRCLEKHWGGAMRVFEVQAWGRDSRVRDDFSEQDLHRELGALVAASSTLEEDVRQVLLEMLSGTQRERAALVLDGLSTSGVRERCEKVAYHLLAGSLRDEVVAWLDEVRQAQARRNELVHGRWVDRIKVADGEVGPALIVERARKPKLGMVRTVRGEDPRSIRAAAGECIRLSVEGWRIIELLEDFSLREARGEWVELPWSRDR